MKTIISKWEDPKYDYTAEITAIAASMALLLLGIYISPVPTYHWLGQTITPHWPVTTNPMGLNLILSSWAISIGVLIKQMVEYKNGI